MFEQNIKDRTLPGNSYEVGGRAWYYSTMEVGERNGKSLTQLETQGQASGVSSAGAVKSMITHAKGNQELISPTLVISCWSSSLNELN